MRLTDAGAAGVVKESDLFSRGVTVFVDPVGADEGETGLDFFGDVAEGLFMLRVVGGRLIAVYVS